MSQRNGADDGCSTVGIRLGLQQVHILESIMGGGAHAISIILCGVIVDMKASKGYKTPKKNEREYEDDEKEYQKELFDEAYERVFGSTET